MEITAKSDNATLKASIFLHPKPLETSTLHSAYIKRFRVFPCYFYEKKNAKKRTLCWNLNPIGYQKDKGCRN